MEVFIEVQLTLTGNDKGLGTSDILKLDINLPMKYNGTLFSDFASNQSISKANNFLPVEVD